MSDLRAWLDEQELQEETVEVSGRAFLVREASLAERGRTLASFDGIEDHEVPFVVACMSVLDPATEEPVVDARDWQYWKSKGSRFADLTTAALKVNGLLNDPVEAELKNSDTTTT